MVSEDLQFASADRANEIGQKAWNWDRATYSEPHSQKAPLRFSRLKHDGFWMNHHRALAYCLRMIFSENRDTLFRIML
jgi:hypothetical protein